MYYKFDIKNDFEEKLPTYPLYYEIIHSNFGYIEIDNDNGKNFFENHFGVSLLEIKTAEWPLSVEYNLNKDKKGYTILTPLHHK